ncbi:fungal-specific transcription factor domain-containing protein [Apiospora rasikravindrae]|uniref:Fungal-specific transcription factor domain-containing protein n=1 Tax=Apiospora rasikravindrae TaxID=990691 RepID=A0ABR1TXW8_9PEZI
MVPMIQQQVSSPPSEFASRPCWTCRQRRVVCDTRLPHCVKCTKSGRECLGYGEKKPVIWVTGMASRGKMAGRTTFAPSAPASTASVGPANLSNTMMVKRPFECVIYDSENPFKRFITLIPQNEALRHVIIALSASHRRNSNGAITLSSKKHEIMMDGLVHEQKAIKGLREAIAKNDQHEAIVALVLLFIWNDALQQEGRQSWRYHLRAMRALINSRRNTPGWNSFFGSYFEETYAILSIFGATLSKQYKSDVCDVFSGSELPAVLQRAEGSSWTGCPAELLQVLCDVNRGVETESLLLIDKFSCSQWAAKHHESASVIMRTHLAEAYRGAISVYALRVLGRDVVRENVSFVVGQAISHLRQIPADDTHFKGILWPAFILGAESTDLVHRAVILEIFQNLSRLLQTWAVNQATIILQEIWSNADDPSINPQSWLQHVRDKGLELFLV